MVGLVRSTGRKTGLPDLLCQMASSNWNFNNRLADARRTVMINLEEVAVVGLGVDVAVVLVLEPVSGAFNLVDEVRTFILRFEFGGHIHFNHGLPY
jgi:hypothetical protein